MKESYRMAVRPIYIVQTLHLTEGFFLENEK